MTSMLVCSSCEDFGGCFDLLMVRLLRSWLGCFIREDRRSLSLSAWACRCSRSCLAGVSCSVSVVWLNRLSLSVWLSVLVVS